MKVRGRFLLRTSDIVSYSLHLKGAVLLSRKVDETPPFEEEKCHDYLFGFNPNLLFDLVWLSRKFLAGIEPPCDGQKGQRIYEPEILRLHELKFL